ncbi:MAG: hypothetical protein ACK5KP_10550 [Paludibacteraceae bacterium]
MKLEKYSIALFAVLSVMGSFAQVPDSVVNKTVNVTREYRPAITDVGKIIAEPKIIEPTVNKSTPVYSDITTPISGAYNIHTLPATELLHEPSAVKKGFLRLGAGIPLNTLGDFMYPILDDKRNRLDVGLHHLGVFGDKKHAKTSLSLQFDHLFESFDLYAGAGGSHDYFNYYGIPYAGTESFIMSDAASRYGTAYYNDKDGNPVSFWNMSGYPVDNTHWCANGIVGIRSLPLADNLIFDAHVSYKLLYNVSSGISENQVRLDGLFEVPFESNRLGLKAEIYNFGYAVPTSTTFDFPDNYSVVKLNPYFKFVGDEWYVKLGARTGISIGSAGQIFSPSADVDAQWNAIPAYLSLYGALTGDLAVNSLYAIYDENRYLSLSERIKDTYTPVNAYLGFKLSPTYNLLFDVYGQYKIIGNQYFYVNKEFERTTAPADMPDNFSWVYLNNFDVVYSRATRASVGIRGSWDYKDQVNVYLKGAYHYWDVNEEMQAWHLPAWDADFGADVKAGSDVSISTRFYFQDGRYAKLSVSEGTKMDPVFDWNLGVSYAYRDWMSFFLRVNNILNKKYEFYKGYQVQGMNGMVGVAFSL